MATEEKTQVIEDPCPDIIENKGSRTFNRDFHRDAVAGEKLSVRPTWLGGLPPASLDISGVYDPDAFARVVRAHLWRVWLTAGKSVHTARFEGPSVVDAGHMIEELRRCGGSLFKLASRPGQGGAQETELACLAWEDGMVCISFKEEEVELLVTGSSVAFLERLTGLLGGFVGSDPARWVNVVIHDGTTLKAKQVGRVTTEFARDNYPPGVLAAFDHVVADMRAEEPCGRFVLLDGPPGTGKTHLVRGLIQALPSATFLLIPPGLGGHLADPSLLGVLVKHRRNARGRPMVVIIEDADSCLVPRQADNASGIATMLNASDGILGAGLDLWIVASTNAAHGEIDAALLRPGRLCQRIAIRPLSPAHARTVFGRLSGHARNFSAPVTLAEVYAAAREQTGTAAPPVVGGNGDRRRGYRRRVAGFSSGG